MRLATSCLASLAIASVASCQSPSSVVDPAASWDGQTTLTCTNGQRLSVRGKNISRPHGATGGTTEPDPTCSASPDGCPLLFAFNGCDLEIVDSTLAAPTVAFIVAPAHVVFRNSTVHGGVERRGKPDVTGLPSLAEEDRKAARAAHLDQYARGACDGVIECYRSQAAWGVISGRLAVTIGPDGRAGSARFENGTASPAIVTCLVAAGRSRRISPFDGTAGLMTCDFAGSLLPSAERMDYSRAFVPSK